MPDRSIMLGVGLSRNLVSGSLGTSWTAKVCRAIMLPKGTKTLSKSIFRLHQPSSEKTINRMKLNLGCMHTEHIMLSAEHIFNSELR